MDDREVEGMESGVGDGGTKREHSHSLIVSFVAAVEEEKK